MRLHFKQFGTGAPLVLLHGLFGAHENWTPIARRLAERFTVYAVDQRNHGRSPHDPKMDYPLMAEDLREFMDEHGISRGNVAGHSMGGKTAMQFAIQHGDRIDRLVVADIAPREYPSTHIDIFEALTSLHLPSFETRTQIEEWLEPAIPGLAVRRFLLKNLARTPEGGWQWRFNLPALRENYPVLRGALRIERPCMTPTLFLCGGDSDYIRDDDALEIQRLFPRSEIKAIPGVGHWLHAEAPDLFAELVRAFLEVKTAASQ